MLEVVRSLFFADASSCFGATHRELINFILCSEISNIQILLMKCLKECTKEKDCSI